MVYNPYGGDAEVQVILGGLFLTYNYLVVDYDYSQFQMAPTVQGVQASNAKLVTVCEPNLTTAGPNTSGTRGSSRAAAIGGGTAGGVIGLAAIAALCYFLVRKRRRDHQLHDQKGAQQNSSSMAMAPELFSDERRPSELALVRHLFPAQQLSGSTDKSCY